MVECPDCNIDMTQHTLKYIHKRRGFRKAVKAPEPEKPAPEPVVPPKPKIIQDIVNDYIEENPDAVSNYLRNERALKAQRKQMNARSLLNNAFQIFYFILLYIIKMPYKKKQAIPGTVQFNKLIAELPEKRLKQIKGQIEFRNDILESQKRINYQNEFDRLQGGKRLPGLNPNTITRMKELQKKSKQSLNGTPSHIIYQLNLNNVIYRDGIIP